jgi:hypothetical protein
MKTFSITINNQTTFTAPSVRTWGPIGNYHWAMYDSNVSFYDVQGFKNINLYSIEMVGSVTTDPLNTLGTSCIVNDYGFILDLTGQMPEVSGTIGAGLNFWNIRTPYNDALCLSKYNQKLTFDAPIQSFKRVSFTNFFAQGNNAELLNTVNLRYNLTFIFNYDYEGIEQFYENI